MPGILDSDFIPPYADAADVVKLLLCKYELCKLLCDDAINGVVQRWDETAADEFVCCEEADEAMTVPDDEFDDGDCKSYFDGELMFDAAAILARGEGSAKEACDE